MQQLSLDTEIPETLVPSEYVIRHFRDNHKYRIVHRDRSPTKFKWFITSTKDIVFHNRYFPEHKDGFPTAELAFAAWQTFMARA